MKKGLLIVALLSGLAANAQESSTWSLQPQAGWTYASFIGRNADHVQSWAGWTAGVTDRKEHGDVILGQGDITLNAGYVKIKNSTKVPYGTKLKIANQ